MIIVTGGAGFIGSALIERLNREGIDDILVVDRLGEGEKWRNLTRLRYRDFMHKDAFIAAIRAGAGPVGVEAVAHLGACSSTTERDADYLMANNFRYSRDLAEWALMRKIRFLYASSAATYGDGALGFDDDPGLFDRLRPLNMYGYSKLLFDQWARRRGLLESLAGLRFFNVYGPGESHKGDMASVVHKAFHQIRQTGALRLFRSARPDYADGEQVRDFVFVGDCVEVMWRLLRAPGVNGVFNLGSGRARSWNELARAVFAAMGRPVRIEFIDLPETLRDRYQYFTEARMDRLAKALGGLPPSCSLAEGAAATIQSLVTGGA